MPFNVMIQLCKVTRASKLFQRNFYLPLLKPLSPKDALRRHIITGKNLLGQKIEHYIPVLEEYKDRIQRRKYVVKGQGKKRQRKKPNRKYVSPFFDENMENHGMLENMISRKPKGKGQCYTYHIPDKNCTLVLPFQFERAIRDRDILDVVIAQRSEKIVIKVKNGHRITMPIAPWDDRNHLYRGEGWTKRDIEETHHHGKETMSLAKLFEAKESGVEEWELEMMRMANKRKVKHKGESKPEWKNLMAATAEAMDWDKFEEEAKEIVEQVNDPVEDEPIPMQVNDMEKTKNVNEKLKNGGEEVLEMLPLMSDIPEVIRFMQDGEYTELADVSGVTVTLPLTAKEVFVAGQIVKSEDGDMFMPGQTVETEDTSEYTPGITVLMDGEPTLLPGLVMGDDPKKPMFLPGESTITESGELQFTETEDDRPRLPTPPPEPEPEIDEVELEEEQNSEEEEEDLKPPPPPPPKKEFIYERPKRIASGDGVKRRERASKRPVISLLEPELEPMRHIQEIEPVLYDLTVPSFEKDALLQEKERTEKMTEKTSKEEWNIEKKKREIKEKAKKVIQAKPVVKEYVPMDPVKKSSKLKDLESSIKTGNFFDVDYKKFLNKDRRQRVNWLEPYDYKNTFDSVGMSRHRVWSITRASKLFQRNYYLPLLRPLSPKDALRRKIITGQNVLGARTEHYIPVLLPYEEKQRDKKSRKGAPIIKKRIKLKESERYVAPFFDDNMENHLLLQSILMRKGKEKNQFYLYDVPDKKCTLIVNNLIEKAFKDKDIIDMIIAQRSEKIVLKLSNGKRVIMPLAKFDEDGVFYRGSGWTKEFVEEEHHHGKETMSLAKIFELKEAGIEDWELEMMRMAGKRKKKVRGEENADFKLVMQAAAENMDWEQFEEDSKQIIEEVDQIVEEEDIPMAVDDMEKTKNVNEKLKQGGDEVLAQLPTMKEIPEVIKNLETGDLCELQNVSGVQVQISDGKCCFVAGQMVKSEENDVFMPGQTVENEDGTQEYTPGITVLIDNEPSLIPGLVFGEEEQAPMFLPGESTITEEGQLQFEATEEDRPKPPPKEETPPPRLPTPPPIEPKPIIIEKLIKRETSPPVLSFRPERQPLEDCLLLYEERRRRAAELEKQRMKERNEEKILKAEGQVDVIRSKVRQKLKNFKVEQPPAYAPVAPVMKSRKLEELEKSIDDGTFENDRTKMILEKVRNELRKTKHVMLMSSYGYDGEYGSGKIGLK